MNAYRDALQAAHARIVVLEREKAALESAPPRDDLRWIRIAVVVLMIAAASSVSFAMWCVVG
jgi:hypothetical protein